MSRCPTLFPKLDISTPVSTVLYSYILRNTGGPDVGGPDVGGPDVGGPDVGGPDVGGPDVGGPDVGGPNVPHFFPVVSAQFFFRKVFILSSAAIIR